jgi:RHS repeat-associated protein
MKVQLKNVALLLPILILAGAAPCYAWIKILQGEKVTVGINHYVAIACSSNEIGGFYDYYNWSEYWGGGTWLTGLSGRYAVFLFDPNFTATSPSPFATGTLKLYTGYYGSVDSIKITAWPEGNFKTGTTCGEGDPVAPSFGNMFQQESEFSYACRGNKLSLGFNRIYAAREIENADLDCRTKWQRPLGYGWTHNYNIYLTMVAGGTYNSNWDVKLHDRNGSVFLFTWNSTYGVYKSEKGNHDYMVKSGSSPNIQWVLRRGDGLTYYFKQTEDLAGRLDSISDNNGNKLRLTYSGTDLTKVEDDMLRAVNIRYHSGTPYVKYVYSPPDTITGYRYNFNYTLNGSQYDLVTVSYKDPTRSDSTTLLYRYYYDANHMLKVRSLPTGRNTEYNDTTGSSRKWDRLTYWYDSDRKLRYEEVVNGDGDTTLSNDKVLYKAHFKYFSAASGYPDSTVVYYHDGPSATGALSPFVDTVPSVPASNYYQKILRFNTTGYYSSELLRSSSGDSAKISYGSYDNDYNPGTITDPNGSITSFKYFAYRDSTQAWRYAPLPDTVKYPNGDTVFTYYSAKAGNRVFFLADSSVDEMHEKTVHLYDNLGNDTAVVYKDRVLADGDGSAHDVTNRYHYNTGGNMIEILDPRNSKTIMHFAPGDTGAFMTEHRIDMAPSGEGSEDIVFKYGYNYDRLTMDTLTFYRDYPNNPSQVIYKNDIQGRPIKILQPDNGYDTLVYDKRGNLLEKYSKRSDTTFVKTTYAYDAQNHLAKVREYRAPNDSANAFDSTYYTYNLNGRMLSLTNALSRATDYAYKMDRMIRVSYPDTTKDSLGYWADGNLKTKTDRNGQVTYYEYDGYSGGCLCNSRYRLTKKKYYDSLDHYINGFSYPSDTVIFDYDKVGNRTKMIDMLGTTLYAYDELYRLKSDSSGYLNTKVKYLYDQANNRTRMKVFKGDDTTTCYLDQEYRHYDNANRVDTVRIDGKNIIFTYWDTGLPKKMVYPANYDGDYPFEEYWANARGYIDSISGSYYSHDLAPHVQTYYRNRYTYNALGDRVSHYKYLTRPGTTSLSGTVGYSYDGLRRLVQVRNPSGFDNGDTITYTYDAAGNRLKKDYRKTSDINYYYNAANNQIYGDGASDYSYDDNGNLTYKEFGRDRYFYIYDCENRIAKVKLSSDSTLFYYNGDGVRLKKLGTKDSSIQYIPDGMYSAVERRTNGNLRYKYVYANGMLLARIDSSGNKHYYYHDGLGSIIGVCDGTNICKSYLYDEFGDSIGTWGSTPYNAYRYTGQEYDGVPLNAYNLRAREYYPKLGRFMQNDPIGDKGGSLNWYTYVANNPINWTDITGLVCGSGWNDPLIPDHYIWGYSFVNACTIHDKCYGTCGETKDHCDEEFLVNMMSECINKFSPMDPRRYECYATAQMYYSAVWWGGWPAWNNAQCKCKK